MFVSQFRKKVVSKHDIENYIITSFILCQPFHFQMELFRRQDWKLTLSKYKIKNILTRLIVDENELLVFRYCSKT